MQGCRLLAVLLLVVAVLRSQTQESGAAAVRRAEPAERTFSTICARCHGLDGRGGEHGPNIATAPRVRQQSDASLAATIRDGKPSAGMPGFASVLSAEQIKAMVEWMRVLQGRAVVVSGHGNAENGRQLFFGKARCSHCHSVAGQGGVIGADLTTWADGRSTDELREAIVEPSRDGDPRTMLVTVTTPDAHTYSGIARNEDNFSLQLQTVDGAFHFFLKSALKNVEHQNRPLMPSDYGSTLSPGELDDIVAFLLSTAAPERTRK